MTVLGAVGLVARAELRTRWRGLVALGLLFGLVGGIVLGTVAVADRTVTAYERLAAATGLADAQVLLPAAHETVFDQVPNMPGVTASWTPVAWIAQINTPAVRFVSLSGGPDHPPGLADPVVVAGRAPRADAANEILVSEPTAADLDMRIGDEVILRLLLARGDRPVLPGVRAARRRFRAGHGGGHRPGPGLDRTGDRPAS